MACSQWVSRLVVLGLVCVLGSGCAISRMETARQLEGGEVVFGGTADMPGALWLPRVGGSAMVGLGGGGDASIYAGTAILAHTVGLGARVYLGEGIIASVHGDLLFLPVVGFDGLEAPALVTINPRITSAATDDRPVYAGVQASVVNEWFLGQTGRTPFAHGFVVVGGVAGLDHLFPTGLGLQGELRMAVLSIEPTEPALDFFPYPQGSVGLYFRPSRAQRPSEAGPTEEYPPVREPAPRERPSEEPGWGEDEPDYDDSGVPLY